MISFIVRIDKITSGIEGFDALLGVGFPQGRTYLIAGEPGRKSLFSMQFLID